MNNNIIDIREEIKNRMKSFDYDNKDMKKRMNKYVLFEKFMAKESFLTIDLAIQIGTILNMDPLDLINKEMNFMKSLEGDNYKIHDKTVQEIEVTINTMKEEKRISRLSKTDLKYEELRKVYNQCIESNVFSKQISYEEFQNKCHQLLKIKNLKYLNLSSYQLDYEELSLYQILVMILWIKNAENKIEKKKRKPFNRMRILMNLEQILELKNENSDKELKEKLYEICKNWGIILIFEVGIDEETIDGFCEWQQTRPIIIVRDRKNAQRNYQEFIKLFSHVMSDQQRLKYYDTKWIHFGEEYDNYIHDYQIIKADRFMKNVLKYELEGFERSL